ncbi:MAG TPA: hypothetical protein VFS19_05195 [Planctomycetota bacterium]|nr:hypothetical protein [Planctomycetota bacterium]
MTADERLTPEQSARVIAISAFFAGGVIFFYLFDHLSFGIFDPGYKLMWRVMAAYEVQTSVHPARPHMLWATWSVVWVVTGVLSFKRQGRRPWTFVPVAVLIAGVMTTALIHQLWRK